MILDDESNLHAHARKNAQNAISMAKQQAVQFDAQAALERKTNEAIALAKAQAHIHDDDEDSGAGKSGTGLVDRTFSLQCDVDGDTHFFCSRFRRVEFPKSYISYRPSHDWSTPNASSSVEGVSIERPELARYALRTGYQWHFGRRNGSRKGMTRLLSAV